MRSSLPPHTRTTSSALIASAKQRDARLFLALSVPALALLPLLVLAGSAFGFGSVVGGLAVLAIGTAIIRWPVAGVYVIAACAVLIEQEPLATPILTDQLYVYSWPANLAGLIERPIGFLFLFSFLVLIAQRLRKRQRLLRGGPLLLPFVCFLLCVAMGVIHGLASGGDFKITVLEIRPFWYLFESYVLAYNLIASSAHVRAFLWLVILGAGVKGLQGVYIYLIALHGNLSNTPAIMAHEESFFFIAVLLLLVLFRVHHTYRAQWYAALLISPAVIVALIANQRRTDYVALVVGMVFAWALIFLVKPQARKRLALGMIIAVILMAGYIAAFYQSSGTLGGPARAVVSVFRPDLADTSSADSNLYRDIENSDLKYTVSQSPLIGWGFGKPFLQPEPLPNIITLDPYYLYIPHNTIYWVWMRLGAIGYAALWYLVGAIIVQGSIITRRLRDPYLQLVAIFIVAVTVMEIIVAYADYQLFFYRNVIYLGLLIGILMKLPGLDAKKEQPVYESADGIRLLARTKVGGQHTHVPASKSAGTAP